MHHKVASVFALLALIFAFACSSHAQTTGAPVAGEGVMKPGQSVPFDTQAHPPALTPEQEQIREDAMRRANRPGPPLPVEPGAEIPVPRVAPTPAQPAPVARPLVQEIEEPPAQPGAASTFTLFRATAQGPYSTTTSPIAETQAGTSGPVVFMTGNWFASYSTDSGASFSFVNPYTQFPTLDAGFCCDQTVIYDHTRDLIIWQLQYTYSTTTQKGSYRTAFAKSSAIPSGGWCYYDWSPATFGLGLGLWLDYPHVALSNSFVWYTANVYNSSNQWQRTIIWRIPLDPASRCEAFNYNWFVVSDHFNFTPTQGATTTMYWGSHNSTSSIRIYNWAENSNTILWNDVSVSTWPNNLPYKCAGPDGLNWCGRGSNDGRIQTGWVARGIVGFMWNASQSTSFPYPYIHVALFNQSTSALISQPILWNSAAAWQFPAVGVNDRGHIAGTASYGGGSLNPTMASWIWDDFSPVPPPWEVYGVVASAKGANAWGDWYSARRHGSNGNTWIATGEALLATGAVQGWYLWLGRERDRTP